MTPTPKELLAAATRIGTEQDYLGLTKDRILLADHILATVRPDDDEPVTEIRFIALLPTLRTPADRKANRKHEIDDINTYISAEFSPSGSCFLDVFIRKNGAEKTGAAFLIDPTWGQFRTLCRVLGITLPEVQE